MPVYFYTAYHLNIASELELPELLTTQAPADIVIKFATIAFEKPDPNSPQRTYPDPDGQGVYQVYAGVGTFKIHQAQEIWLNPLPEAPQDMIRAFLLGPVLGTLLYLRGHLVLHASCVVIGPGAVAFMGVSGEGKSTITSFLNQRGHPVVADDKVLIKTEADGQLVVIPGYPHIRLWPDAVAALGLSNNDLPDLFPGISKKSRRLESEFFNKVVSLSALYVLTSADTVAIEPLRGQQAFLELAQHRYMAPAIPFLGEDAQQFQKIGQITQHIPIYRLSRPRQFECMENVIEQLETRHLYLFNSPLSISD
jgi:hypothetical protein